MKCLLSLYIYLDLAHTTHARTHTHIHTHTHLKASTILEVLEKLRFILPSVTDRLIDTPYVKPVKEERVTSDPRSENYKLFWMDAETK